ncbi:MAG: hypothetical protein AVDCRST_MAG80-1250 [uncultured Rubrobacteraceae bacterium]|uniref:Uncharacterized protein n=1 Tax=uncultured Rubrobacteraceae bacterium TaxID=349277 RepID=A0A6J4QL38_9ACTN|nr:MAG: hypothetical protein AVDCRST_MAG80-1250 [uncultured Rubrobacteraceae bacterium]
MTARIGSGGEDAMRVLIANAPRAYREVISVALKALRPQFEVLTVEPEDLDEEISRLALYGVVCSRLTASVESCAAAWIELYPDHSSWTVVDLRGQRTRHPEMYLDGLLSFIDRAGLLYET